MEIRDLAAAPAGAGLEVQQVVIYLREPLALIESLFSTMVRSGDQRPCRRIQPIRLWP